MASSSSSSSSYKLPTTCELDEHGKSVWVTILAAEEHAANASIPKDQAAYKNDLIGIRVLGFFLLDFYKHAQDGYLGSRPYSRLLIEIKRCMRKEKEEDVYCDLQALGLRYRNYLIRVFRSNTGSRPSSSAHVSRPSVDRLKERILDELEDAPQTRSSARRQALLRDGYKCTLSGLYNRQYLDTLPELREAQRVEGQNKSVFTEVAHVFSEKVQDGDKDYAVTVLAMLEMFGLDEKARELYGAEVNGLHNVITMSMDFHTAFDRLEWWLEPVPGMENTYDICGENLDEFTTPFFESRRVTFTVEQSAAEAAQRKGKTLRLPDPYLIAIRAACSRVANVSGAARHYDEILWDLEDITVLADDGSMADLLSLLLAEAVPMATSAVQVVER